MMSYKQFFAAALVVASGAISAQEGTSLETDWLELVKGHKGETMGVELREIEAGDTEGTRKITLAVPKGSMSHPDTIEEVVVIGRKPEERVPLDIQYEWLDDYDDDNYGLVIHIGESNWPIRLYMNSAPGYTR